MSEWIGALVLKLMRVPAEPQPPDGSRDSVRIFRAGRNYYRWLMFQWIFAALAALLLALIALLPSIQVLPKLPAWGQALWVSAEGFILAAAFSFIVVSYYAVRLNYELRWYIVTDRSLRIRNGIWSVEELTMTFANIQDIRINAGPLQTYLGLADLIVSSAGGGQHATPGLNPHLACFSGIDNAESVRNLITDRLRQYRDAGLGDHEQSTPAAASTSTIEDEAAARQVLREVQALRATVAGLS